MKSKPENIESLFELKTYLDCETSKEILDLTDKILKCREVFELLEQQHFQADGDDLKKVWKLFCLPEELTSMKVRKLEELEKMKAVFFMELVNQQNDFHESITDLKTEIQLLCNFKSVDQLDDVLLKIQGISHKLEQIKVRVLVFNQRETLLMRNPTDYSYIEKSERSFLVYKDLWDCIKDWVTYKGIGNGRQPPQVIQKLNGFLNYFNEKKSKQTLDLIDMIEAVKAEVQASIV